jgi:ribonuclease HII
MRKAWEETQQKEAFKDLLLIRGANGGKLKFNDMKDLVEKYKRKGYAAVTRDNLYYRLRCYKAAKIDEVIGSSVTLIGRQSTLSDLTSSPSDIINTNIIDDGTSNNDAANIHPKKGGRPKGSTKAAAEKINAVVKESVTTATIRYNEALQKALNSGKKVVPKRKNSIRCRDRSRTKQEQYFIRNS